MESHHESLCSIIRAISASPTWIDEDLMPEILKRLPVKALCRFRSVCRSWNSLISSAYFINLHYSFNSDSSTTPAQLQPYLRLREFRGRSHKDYALCRPQDGHLRRPLFFPFRFRPCSYVSFFRFVGLIRGVVCLTYTVNSYSHIDSTILWNPATHSYVAVPPPVNPDDPDACGAGRNIIAFGYDSAKNDLKVVRVWLRSLVLVCEVFSAQQGTWRGFAVAADHIEISYIHCISAGCFVNGAIHWLGSSDDLIVVLFDCELEEFRTIELPQEILDLVDSASAIELLDYGSMLSVLVANNYGDELWVMEEHDAATTWKRLFRISDDTDAIDIYESSYLKLAPYGPNEWIKFRWNDDLFDDMLNTYIYLESMFLMDDTKARFYTKEEILYLDDSLPFYDQVSN